VVQIFNLIKYVSTDIFQPKGITV